MEHSQYAISNGLYHSTNPSWWWFKPAHPKISMASRKTCHQQSISTTSRMPCPSVLRLTLLPPFSSLNTMIFLEQRFHHPQYASVSLQPLVIAESYHVMMVGCDMHLVSLNGTTYYYYYYYYNTYWDSIHMVGSFLWYWTSYSYWTMLHDLSIFFLILTQLPT